MSNIRSGTKEKAAMDVAALILEAVVPLRTDNSGSR